MPEPTANRALRVLGIVLGCIIVLAILFWLAVRLLVNPNDYKGRIEAAVRQSTGRELSLPGDIGLSLFPSIALRLGPASLGNPPGFSAGPFASLQRVSLSVQLLPLLHKQLQVGHVEIDGLDLNLEKNARGQGNWDLSGSAAKTTTTPAAPSTTSSTTIPEMDGLVIKNARFSYQDEVADHIGVNIGRLTPGAAVPISFKLDLTQSAGAKPIVLAGKLDLTLGTESFQVTDLDVQLDDSRLRGNAGLGRGANQPISFDLALDHIDLDRYLSANASATAPKQPTTSASTAPTELPVDLIRTLQVHGKLTIGSAKLDNLAISQVNVGLAASNGLMHIAPATAQLYGGSSSGDITLDARGATPVVTLDQSIKGVDIKPLVNDFMHSQRLAGRGDLTLNVKGEGADSSALMRTLSGRTTVNLANGAVVGADVWFEVRRALALFQRQAAPAGRDQGETRFDTFRTSADIAHGVATTKDLTVTSQDLRLTGEGSANLVTQAINYRLQVAVLQGAPAAGSSTAALLTVPVDVTGTLANYQVRPDLAALAKQNLLNKGQLQKKLPGLLRGLLNGH